MKHATILLRACALGLLSCLLLACAAPRALPAPPAVSRDTAHDTLVFHDSVYISRIVMLRGDTVYERDTVYRLRYRDRVVERARIDSVPYPVEVVRLVPHTPPFFAWCTVLFFVLLVLLTFRLGWRIYRRGRGL